ncbi:DEAD/DEAH box helicase [archaeon]|jgi:ATP-dependent RNA helicase DeaD|nr:DEAD/DEAH box helicase [archaeon]MBT4021770.1 DEAD/DEAH box helicase [archaeon]MBT4271815.1 DEAD/DEAH box helicase [archaeon]MBT4460490.1 DEAD/DEAH box helicase [archaeon]MBT4858510.1 DEAD/DEAH box helicase [archaeon]
MNKFEKLGISKEILKTITEKGFENPTEIQEKSIPVILKGNDLIAGSATGSGKTLAFSCAIIEHCEKGQGVQSIVLTPTRELCVQITKEMQLFSKYKGLKITPIYGGVSINPQMDDLTTTDVVIGTPGRVLDHLSRGTLDLSKVRVAVLDEADRMLDMGFIDDVKQILGECPQDKQTLLYSATISTDIYEIAEQYMNNPKKISVESYVDPSLLKQVYYDVPMNLKFSLLVHLMKNEHSGLIMVFCNTQRTTSFVAKNLQKNGIKAIAIHGGLSQAKRNRSMDDFKDGDAFVLVCTDVAARGLDIKDVSHVYNYDTPKESKQYIHRIGRTARAGSEGIAINLLSSSDHENFDRVLRDNSTVHIEHIETPEIQQVRVIRVENDRGRNFHRRGNNNRRPNNNHRRGNY